MFQKIGSIIFARYDSSRLFGKALIDIGGRCLLGRVIDRAKNIEGSDVTIVATTDRQIDDKIVSFLESENVEIFRGDCDDVFGRAVNTCKMFDLDGFARICGDRPFFDYQLVSNSISLLKTGQADFVTTMRPRTVPPGLTTEALNAKILYEYDKRVVSHADREHVTSFFYREPINFRMLNIGLDTKINFEDVSLVVDTEEDLIKAIWIDKQIRDHGLYSDTANIVHFAKIWARASDTHN